MAGEDIGKTMFWIAIIIGVLIGATLIFVNKFQNSEIKEVSLSSDALFNGANFSLEEKDLFIVNFENKNYSFTLDSIEKDKISLKKGAIEYELIGSFSLEFDLNRDDIIDIIVSVIKIDEKKGVVNLSVEYPVIELCTELWSCSGWGDCIEGVRKRVCVDDNLCGTVLDKPALEETCEMPVENETEEILNNETENEIEIDCGEGINNCFISAAQDCSLAKTEWTVSLDLFGINTTTETLYGLLGYEGEYCVYYQEFLNITLKYTQETIDSFLSENMTLEEIEAQEINLTNQARESSIGTGTICNVTDWGLVLVLENWAEGFFSVSSSVDIYGNANNTYDVGEDNVTFYCSSF